MKNKALIIILIAAATALGAYLVYRNMKHGEVTRQQQDTRNRMVDLAKRSPKSGLAEMARAAKRYYADNKSYPPDLNSLFPKYIKTEALIDDIDWRYKPSGNGFLLSKSIIKNGQRIIASIDDSLRFKADKKIMLASRSAEGASEQKISTVVSRRKEIVPSMISKVNETDDDAQVLMSSNTQALSVKEKIEMISVKNQHEPTEESDEMDMIGVKKQLEISGESDTEEKITQLPEQKEPVLIAKVVGSRAELIADAGSRYLVWIGRDGHLGFSNVQYPDSEKIGYYYLGGKWESAIR